MGSDCSSCRPSDSCISDLDRESQPVLWIWCVGFGSGWLRRARLAGRALVWSTLLHLLHATCTVMVRIFQEKPLFIIPRGQPVADAEDVAFPTADGLTLHGCYLQAPRPRAGRHPLRPGVRLQSLVLRAVLRIPARQRLRHLHLRAARPGRQRVAARLRAAAVGHRITRCSDFQAALAYLEGPARRRPARHRLLRHQQGGQRRPAGRRRRPVRPLLRHRRHLRHATPRMVPYMRKWIRIYSKPHWCCRHACRSGTTAMRPASACGRSTASAQLPLPAPGARACRGWRRGRCFMIHGGGDTYIKPEMAQALFDRAARAQGILAGRGRQAQPGPSGGRRASTSGACSTSSTSTWRHRPPGDAEAAPLPAAAKPQRLGRELGSVVEPSGRPRLHHTSTKASR